MIPGFVLELLHRKNGKNRTALRSKAKIRVKSRLIGKAQFAQHVRTVNLKEEARLRPRRRRTPSLMTKPLQRLSFPPLDEPRMERGQSRKWLIN